MKNTFFPLFCCSVLLLIVVSHSAVNYPYPQRKNYGNSTINTTDPAASNSLRVHFEKFLSDFYVTGTCGGNNCARIKFGAPGDPTETVSEGIGYGMLMMVYFSESDSKSYKDHFDRLWRYYKQFSNSNGIMNWKVKHGNANSGFSDGNVTGSGGATDAEYDAALALIMAYYQWGGDSYLTEARTLIGNIWSKEHNTSTGLHYPGDQWQNDFNPSYVAPAAYEIFKSYGTSADWTKALSANYTFLKANQNEYSTGLPSGWASADGKPKTCSNNCGITTIAYDQDAVRAPWRWATANAWFGHADAKTLLTKLGQWVQAKDPSAVKGPITLSGNMGANGNSSYVGSLACALTHNSSYQSQLNDYWSFLNGIENEPYFNAALRILTGLLITGNMPNLKACKEGSCGTDMPAGGGDSNKGTAIDRFKLISESDSEESRGYAATWEPWYAYTDNGSNGSSTITNTKFKAKDENDNCKEIDSYRVVMKDGSDWVAKIPSYTLVKGSNEYAPFVAIGLDAKKNGDTYNFSACTDGFSYEYKGQGHNFKVMTKAIVEEGSDHFKTALKSTEWQFAEVPISQLKQPAWGTTVALNLSGIYGFAWEVKGSDDGTAGVSALTGELAIKNFRCLGNNLALPSSPNLKCGGAMPSSTSQASSSSVASGASSSSAGSSSSVASGTSSSSSNRSSSSANSSSSIGNTPILLSQIVHSNALITMQNAVNIQVTDDVAVKIFDLKGNSVRALRFARGSYIVQMADLPKGLYLVKANSGSWKQTITVPVK